MLEAGRDQVFYILLFPFLSRFNYNIFILLPSSLLEALPFGAESTPLPSLRCLSALRWVTLPCPARRVPLVPFLREGTIGRESAHNEG